MDYAKTLADIARAIVDSPDKVFVEETVEEKEITLVLTVADEDTGMVIGRHGRIAKAIRTIMKVAANANNVRINVEIK